jgi:glyoxylase-like metal-dependent hydrolase (beta-lactamase superfamily II)
MKVAEGVHRVDGVRISNAYLVSGDDGLVLVDTGIPGNAKRILAFIERLGHRPDELRAIVLTHWHIDHVGSVAELQRLTGAPVAIHELDAPVLAGRERPAKGRRAMAVITWLFRLRPATADRLLRDGDRVGGLEVLHVPGHTAGSIALRRADGVVFSGDALLGDRHGGIRPPDPGLSLDPVQARASAEKIRGLGFTLLLPGHGRPAAGSR